MNHPPHIMRQIEATQAWMKDIRDNPRPFTPCNDPEAGHMLAGDSFKQVADPAGA